MSASILRRCLRRVPVVGLALAALGTVSITGCTSGPIAFFAVRSAPAKTANPATDAQTDAALSAFRSALLDGAYDRLPAVRAQLTGAYLTNPRQPTVALYLGMSHLWSLSESGRLTAASPTVTDHAVLANKYLTEAARLAPDDLRIPGFVASTELTLGSLHQDEKLTRQGYFDLLDAMRRKTDFNGFTASYVLSRSIASDPSRLDDLIEYMWRAQEDCLGRSLDRKVLDLRAQLAGGFEQASAEKRRICWNSALVPHNIEGFFMHFGDLYVARGDLAEAQTMYRNAAAMPSYAQWKYRPVLEARIADRAANAKLFRTPATPDRPTLMTTAAYSCSACHEK